MKSTPVLAAVLVLLCLSGCSSGNGDFDFTKMPVGIDAEVAREEEIQHTLTAIGTIEANEMVSIQSEMAGLVAEILFNEGDTVAKGQELVRLDASKLKASLQQAEANHMLAEQNLKRSEQLLAQNALSRQEFDQVVSQSQATGAEVALAREQLKDSRISAPFDGTIGERLISPGQYIEPGKPITSLVDDDPVKILFTLPERHASQVAPKQEIVLKVAAHPGREFKGHVYFIDPQVDTATRTVKAKAEVANPGHLLKPGMFANIELIVGNRRSPVVSEQALIPIMGKSGYQVYVIKNDTAELRNVEIGVRLPGRVEILEGLKAGEKVAVAGLQKLAPGKKVYEGDQPPPQKPS